MGLAQVLCPLFAVPGFMSDRLRFAQVVIAHRQIGMRLDHLDRFTLLPNEARPQCFVAHHDTVQRTLQHLSIQRPVKPHRAAHVVRLADAFQLRQEP
ncbi:non-ribosomal peptide synthetase modules domain protein [Burkholderia pseudomallei MSHR640]|nr:non-ribosomal peptide synthetase modules domain protein [Burkholderia pseudomallei MSHR640]